MSTQQGFLNAIRADTEDLTHRLIYADWLEDQGSSNLDAAQAELIRVQTARETADPQGLDFWILRARERILIERWGMALAGVLSGQVEDLRFNRGFIEAVALTSESYASVWRTLLGAAPIRGVALAGYGEPLTPEMLAPLIGLRLWNVMARVENSEWQREFAPAMRPRQLDISVLWLDLLRAGLEYGWPLRHLGLGTVSMPRPGGNLNVMMTFNEESLDPLVQGPIPDSLVSLDLRGLQLPTEGWEWFFARPFFRQIERLSYWADSGIGNAFDVLSHQPNLTNLRSLWLGGTPGERFRLRGPSLAGLRQLVVQGDGWFDTTSNHQVTRLAFPELTSLRQEFLRDGADLIGLLSQDDSWQALRVLEFRRWQVNYAEDLPAVLDLAVLPRLRRLEVPALPETGFSAVRGAFALAELTITATDLSTSIAAVSKSTVLPELVSLEIARARLHHPEDLEPLLDRSRFPQLRRLEIGGLNLDDAWRHRFRMRFGDGATFTQHPKTVFAVHDNILEGWL